ncbi:MAG: cation transporter [Desulfobacterales bacterium]|jgi:divalent metal cation (Fe/Co/Zn/Cd) transporter|nr:cation transporter [Desulfobacterales bacterium]
MANLYTTALLLARITVFYNIAEGVVSVFFGAADETLSLFGFGVDSFVEVVSGVGIWHMISRMMRHPGSNPDSFERTALRITGTAFYVLAAGLVVTALINLHTGQRPENTFWGIVISLISIVTMWLLIHFKLKVGRALQSDAIIADANCTQTCLYLSFVLLISSLGYELTGIGWFDSLGAVAIAVFSYREGKEAFEKAKGKSGSCRDCHSGIQINCK